MCVRERYVHLSPSMGSITRKVPSTEAFALTTSISFFEQPSFVTSAITIVGVADPKIAENSTL